MGTETRQKIGFIGNAPEFASLAGAHLRALVFQTEVKHACMRIRELSSPIAND
jgi:hypothetical protein